MLQIVLPFSIVLCSVDVLVHTTPVGLVIGPLALVDVTIDMREPSDASGAVLAPLPDEFGSVWPSLFSKAVSEASFPFSDVDSSGLENVRSALFSLG